MTITDPEHETAWLRPAQAAKRLDVSTSTFYKHLDLGTFPFSEISEKIGGRWKVSVHKLNQFHRGELRPDGDA